MASWSAFRLLLQPHHNCQPVKPTVRQLNDKDDERQGHYIIQWPPTALLAIATKFPRPTIMNMKKKAKKATKGYRFYYGYAEPHKKVTLGNVLAGGNYSVKGTRNDRDTHPNRWWWYYVHGQRSQLIDLFIHFLYFNQSLNQSLNNSGANGVLVVITM